jgi:hypothetical protein
MKKIIFILYVMLAVLVTSCELPDNIDPKHALSVAPEAVFTDAEIALVDQIGSINVNSNISRLLVQYHSETTYVTESRYNFSDRQIPDSYFQDLYQGVLMNMKIAYETLKATPVVAEADIKVQKNKMAIIEICNVYAYQILVDAFGNVPYTEALMGADNSRPVYDDAQTIYLNLVDRLDAAIAEIDSDYGSFGDADVIYGGDPALWKEFAATLKLRIAIRLADVPAAGSSTLVSEALATGVFTDQTESAICVYYGIAPYVNSYYNEFVLNARKDFCPTKTLVDKLFSLNDPRMVSWITQYPVGSGLYKGEPYGLKGSSKYNNYSHFVNTILLDPKYPVILSDYVEVEFLLAEASERSLGGLTPAGAEAHYNNAILASCAYWGVSDADAATYLTKPNVVYSTAAATWKEKIGNQKWLGLFDRGVEAWAEWRRLDYPVLTPPQEMTPSDIPVRMPYPYNENKMNETNYAAAAAAIGGDKVTTKLFWDKF